MQTTRKGAWILDSQRFKGVSSGRLTNISNRREGLNIALPLRPHLSPLGWEHINLTGKDEATEPRPPVTAIDERVAPAGASRGLGSAGDGVRRFGHDARRPVF